MRVLRRDQNAILASVSPSSLPSYYAPIVYCPHPPIPYLPILSSSASLTPSSHCSSFSFRRFMHPIPANDKQLTNGLNKALLRYHLYHPLTPRPLRFSRLRALRHWTIHRAWLLHQRHLRESHERELERMYQSMYRACETLRNLPVDPKTNMVGPNGMYGSQGYLYRKAMEKKGVWGTWPIEASRSQTEWPSRLGWNTEWRR